MANLWHEELALMGGDEAAALELLAADTTGGLEKSPAPPEPADPPEPGSTPGTEDALEKPPETPS